MVLHKKIIRLKNVNFITYLAAEHDALKHLMHSQSMLQLLFGGASYRLLSQMLYEMDNERKIHQKLT